MLIGTPLGKKKTCIFNFQEFAGVFFNKKATEQDLVTMVTPRVLHFDFLFSAFFAWKWKQRCMLRWLLPILGGGNSNIFSFYPLPGEMIQFDSYFSVGLKPPPSIGSWLFFFVVANQFNTVVSLTSSDWLDCIWYSHASKDGGPQKGSRIVFQPSIFRGNSLLVSGRVIVFMYTPYTYVGIIISQCTDS